MSMMVGRTLKSFYVRTYNEISETVLSVRNLSRKGEFEDVSFDVHKGEILGFSGLVGAGRSEIMQSVFGALPSDRGEIVLNGNTVKFKNPKQAIKAGISLVPEDRKNEGLVLMNSVSYNIKACISSFCYERNCGKPQKISALVSDYMQRLRIKAASPEIEVSSLSGGNQQKVVLAKWLAARPDVLILDEPTRGVDVGAKQEIYSIINDLAANGMAIIMVSSDLPEIINMCDSVCVVRSGRIVAKLPREELTQERIMNYATGGNEQ